MPHALLKTLARTLGSACLAIPALAAAQPAQEGAAVFKQQCQMCHVNAKGARPTIAPNLYGVVGRKAASSDFASYSAALKASGLAWTSANLDRFLAAPAKLVPGTKMVIALPDAQKRGAVVAYLQSLK